MKVGDKCKYKYRGPFGFDISPQLFDAEIIGFTEQKVRIEAVDPATKEKFRTIVWPESLTLASLESVE